MPEHGIFWDAALEHVENGLGYGCIYDLQGHHADHSRQKYCEGVLGLMQDEPHQP